MFFCIFKEKLIFFNTKNSKVKGVQKREKRFHRGWQCSKRFKYWDKGDQFCCQKAWFYWLNLDDFPKSHRVDRLSRIFKEGKSSINQNGRYHACFVKIPNNMMIFGTKSVYFSWNLTLLDTWKDHIFGQKTDLPYGILILYFEI